MRGKRPARREQSSRRGALLLNQTVCGTAPHLSPSGPCSQAAPRLPLGALLLAAGY